MIGHGLNRKVYFTLISTSVTSLTPKNRTEPLWNPSITMKNVLISATLSATLALAPSSLAQDVDLRVLVGATAAIRSPQGAGGIPQTKPRHQRRARIHRLGRLSFTPDHQIAGGTELDVMQTNWNWLPIRKMAMAFNDLNTLKDETTSASSTPKNRSPPRSTASLTVFHSGHRPRLLL